MNLQGHHASVRALLRVHTRGMTPACGKPALCTAGVRTLRSGRSLAASSAEGITPAASARALSAETLSAASSFCGSPSLALADGGCARRCACWCCRLRALTSCDDGNPTSVRTHSETQGTRTAY